MTVIVADCQVEHQMTIAVMRKGEPMSDLISRKAMREAMYHEAMEKDSDEQKWDGGCWIRYKMFERVIESLPSAQPEIIRCKDCKHFNDGDCEELPKLVSEDDFCSFAERRTDG